MTLVQNNLNLMKLWQDTYLQLSVVWKKKEMIKKNHVEHSRWGNARFISEKESKSFSKKCPYWASRETGWTRINLNQKIFMKIGMFSICFAKNAILRWSIE